MKIPDESLPGKQKPRNVEDLEKPIPLVTDDEVKESVGKGRKHVTEEVDKLISPIAESREQGEQQPKLPPATPLIGYLKSLNEEKRGKFIEKFKNSKRAYQFTKDGKRIPINLDIIKNEDGGWEVIKITYDENGNAVKEKFLKPEKLKFRQWKKPTEEQLPESGKNVLYRTSKGKLVHAQCAVENGTYRLTYVDDGKAKLSTLTAEQLRRCADKEGKNPVFSRRQPERPTSAQETSQPKPAEAPKTASTETAPKTTSKGAETKTEVQGEKKEEKNKKPLEEKDTGPKKEIDMKEFASLVGRGTVSPGPVKRFFRKLFSPLRTMFRWGKNTLKFAGGAIGAPIGAVGGAFWETVKSSIFGGKGGIRGFLDGGAGGWNLFMGKKKQ